MKCEDDLPTSEELLERLRHEPTDEAAWCEFVDRYGGRIVQWCQRWGLQPADAEDVVQNVLLELSQVAARAGFVPGSRPLPTAHTATS